VLLTEASWGPEMRRRMVVDEGRAAEAGRRSRTDDSRGARGSLVARIGRGSPCGGNQGVRAARDRPATRELGRRHSSPVVVLRGILMMQRLGVKLRGSGSF
jgi:hypothetical protein